MFNYNYLLLKHNERKFPCDTDKNINTNYDNKINEIEEKINKYIEMSLNKKTKCFFCNKILINKGNLTRHINNSCYVKKELTDERDKLLSEKNKLIDEHKKNLDFEDRKNMKKQIKLLIEQNKLLKKTNNITINNNNNNNNTQNNIVVINPFGKEDLSHIGVNHYKKYLNGFFPGFIKYVEKVHFDENAPQNYNICLSNLRSKYLTIHDGNKWITKMKDEILDRFINKKHNQLVDKCEELEEAKKIDKEILENFNEFCGNFADKLAKKTTKNDIITMLYDNRNKIKNKIKNIKPNLESDSEEDIPIKKLKKIKKTKL